MILDKKLLSEIKKGNVHYFYTSYKWRLKRNKILERDNNECQLCKENGRVTAGAKGNPLIVHHIQELKHKPTLALEDVNLLSVCNDCHENVCHPNRLGEWQEKKRFTNEEKWE